MLPSSLPLIVAVLLTSSPSFAGTADKLKSFKDSKAKLEADIDLFLKEVDACNPPIAAAKDQIMKGFGDLTKPDSAKSMLNLSEASVTQHVVAADANLSSIEKSSGSCGDKSALLAKASDAANDAQKNLGGDHDDFKKGSDVANSKRTLILGILDMRQKAANTHIPLPSAGDLAQCDAAKKQIDVLSASNNDLLAKIGDLQGSFADRLGLVQASLNAPNACGSTAVKKALWIEEDRGAEAQEGETSLAI
ncbi:MAG: hypothetical protein ACXVB9_14330 [Bdellovibrionota bacterium]